MRMYEVALHIHLNRYTGVSKRSIWFEFCITQGTLQIAVQIYIYICISCIDQPRKIICYLGCSLLHILTKKKIYACQYCGMARGPEKPFRLLGCNETKSVTTLRWHCCLSIGLFCEFHDLILAWYSCFTHSHFRERKCRVHE